MPDVLLLLLGRAGLRLSVGERYREAYEVFLTRQGNIHKAVLQTRRLWHTLSCVADGEEEL